MSDSSSPAPSPSPVSTDYSHGFEGDMRRWRRERPDRISPLPDEILLQILSLLPMQDVLKTDVLSKRWQYLWTSVPSVRFSSSYFEDSRSFVDAVNKILVLAGCACTRMFAVEFVDYQEEFAADVSLWVRFAAKNKVEELTLDLGHDYWSYNSNLYCLPEHMYVNTLLTELSLSKCDLTPSGYVAWDSLKSLSIGCIELEELVLRNILSGSPSLEFLELRDFYGIDRVHISNPSVKKLVINGYEFRYVNEDDEEGVDDQVYSTLEISGPNLHSLSILGSLKNTKCRVTNVASLVEANLNFDIVSQRTADDEYEESQNIVRRLFQSLGGVHSLTVGTWCIKVLSTFDLEHVASPWLRSKKRKLLTIDTGYDKWELPGIASLLDRSFCLETLVININPSFTGQPHIGARFPDFRNSNQERYWEIQERVFWCLLRHLKTVTVNQLVYGGRCGAKFLHFLLGKARCLEKMTVNPPKQHSWDNLFRAAQKLLSAPRSSPKAVVVFNARR
ncbi:hypothetical protein RJ639_009820 [Escallonia herrerae]|uniref:F-box domain-containing protein n=1 Tax=Escallonia herrerae TaxID=1293975 RepID=A0AA88VV36_9ASTE|nr:hypothetical protein RJ639_009820 [Escallonia herrerae]